MAKRGSVLICDDEEVMRDVLGVILSDAGYKIELAKTGEEAVEIYSQKDFDCVLMDVSMPGMGGLTALQELIKLDPEAVVLNESGSDLRFVRFSSVGIVDRPKSFGEICSE